MKSQALLHLMHLVSPALPVGAYAYSQGLEFAIDSGWLKTEAELTDWVGGVLTQGVGQLDLPLLSRLYDAWAEEDWHTLKRWNDYIRAARETHELLLEDEQMGQALNRLLVSLEVPNATHNLQASFVTQFALAASFWQVPKAEALQGFAFSWLENQIAAATKLVPLGQTRAQILLLQLMEHIAPVCEYALTIEDDAIGYSLPGLALASSLHERQYSRLFRS